MAWLVAGLVIALVLIVCLALLNKPKKKPAEVVEMCPDSGVGPYWSGSVRQTPREEQSFVVYDMPEGIYARNETFTVQGEPTRFSFPMTTLESLETQHASEPVCAEAPDTSSSFDAGSCDAGSGSCDSGGCDGGSGGGE